MKIVHILILLVTMLSLSGCGGSDGDSATGNIPPQTNDPVTTPTSNELNWNQTNWSSNNWN